MDMEYNAGRVIYMLTARGSAREAWPELSDVTIFKDKTGYWSVGKDPKGFEKWVTACCPYSRIQNLKLLLHTAGILFLSHIVYREGRGGIWSCVKNRFGDPASARPPFSSLEEARLISAANAWPDPVLIGELE